MIKKVTAIVQVRIGSSRLKEKCLKKINGKEIIILLLDRLSKSKKLENIIVAIPNKKEDDLLFKVLKKNNYNIFRGNELNVLKRYYDCAKKNNIKNILRITGDCPLVDPLLVDNLISLYQAKKVDYLSNIGERTYPDGMDVEIFSYKALSIAHSRVVSSFDKEHVTHYFLKSNTFKKFNFLKEGKNLSNLRLTLDTMDDFKLIKMIFQKFKNKFFSLKDIIKLYKKNKNPFLKILKKKNILVVIPARSKSTGFKNKNIFKINGLPLLVHSINYAKKSKLVDKIIVSSDSQKYLDIAKKNGAETPFLRKKKISGNLVPDFPVIKDALVKCEKTYKKKYDFIILLRPTSPFREKGLIEKGFELLKKNPNATSLRSVIKVKNHPYRTWVYNKNYISGFVKNKFEPYTIPRQLLPKVMFQTGCIEIIKRETLHNNSIAGNNVIPIFVKKYHDIDSYEDIKK